MKKSRQRLSVVLLALALAALCACAPAEKAPAESAAPGQPEPSSSSQPAPAPESPSQPEPEAEPEPSKSPVDAILDSYYLDDAPELKGSDIIYVPGVTVDNTRLVPEYTTGTSGRQEMRTLLEKLLAGEKLADHLLFDKRYYALAYDSDGKIAGHVELDEGFEIGSYSYFIEESADLYRWDFRYPELLESVIQEGKIDPDTAGLKFCNFADFATGALLYDSTREYFIPTVRDAMHTVEFQVATLYPVPELAEMLQSRITELFPENEVDGFGNPY